MSSLKKRFISEGKVAVKEILKVLKADIDFGAIGSSTGTKKALEIKKNAFIKAKGIIRDVLDFDYSQQDWARETIGELIESGKESTEALIASMGDEIKIAKKSSKEIIKEAIDGADPSLAKIKNNAQDINNAVDAKFIAFNDAYEIMEHIEELERISKEDEIILKDTEFNEGYPEIYADKYEDWGDKGGFSKKAGYDPEIDAVKICPNGTIGKIIVIEGLRIALPKAPTKSNTLFSKKKKADQFWTRQAPPKTLNTKNAKSFNDFIESEFKRKREGVWFMNNGKQEYVTGAHWFLMNNCRTGADGFFYYFSVAQQKLLTYAEACWCDERCSGMILEKIRRFGATDCMMAMGLCKGITARNKILGMTSKKDSDAKKNFKRQTYMFSNLPFYFKPICKDERSTTMLDFSAPGTKLSKNNKDAENVDNSLNTYLNYESTTEDSYDGDAVYFYLGDEFSKWKKQNGNTISHLEMIQKSVTKGFRITGKTFIISTIEMYTGKDADDDDALSGDRYKKLYYDSIPTERDGNDQTRSGMYKIFISCLEHYEGLIDPYGYPITEDPEKPIKTIDGAWMRVGIRTVINNKLASFKGSSRARIEFLRKTPLREEDGFAVKDGNCIFNQGNLMEQLMFMDGLPKNKYGLPGQLRRGNFEWSNGIEDCGKVLWNDCVDGRFLVSWMPPEDMQNSFILKGKKMFPANATIGAFGIDDYRVTKAANGKGSKGAEHGYAKENTHAPSHQFFLEYLCRPKDKPTFRNDMIMSMIFYGMPALIENNVDDLLKEMHRRGYSGYSLRRPDKKKEKLSYDEALYGGIPAQNESIRELQSSSLEFHIEHRIGELETDQYADMYFRDTVLDWMVFDPKNRTKRDASISSSLAIIGATSGVKRSTADRESRKKLLQNTMGRFDNTGVKSKHIRSINTGLNKQGGERKSSGGRYKN